MSKIFKKIQIIGNNIFKFLYNKLDVIKEFDKISNFKNSLNMKKEIDEYFNSLNKISKEDFKINNIVIIKQNIKTKI